MKNKEIKKDELNLNAKRNPVADCFKIFSIFVIFLGMLLILIQLYITFNNPLIAICNFIIYTLSLLIMVLIFRAIAEIIQLLEDIKNK